jgi:hypothetical protein
LSPEAKKLPFGEAYLVAPIAKDGAQSMSAPARTIETIRESYSVKIFIIANLCLRI